MTGFKKQPVTIISGKKQPTHTSSTSPTAQIKAAATKPEPTDLVSVFENKNLQEEIKRILKRNQTCHADQTFIPHQKSLILGPKFIIPRPVAINSLYPQPKDYPLSFQVKPDWSKWANKLSSWPTWRKTEWVDWVNHLEPYFGKVWRDVGLYEFTQLTKCKFDVDKSILSVALLFWSGSFNCFHFPCGTMSVTLFNISSLTSLPCTGEEITACLIAPPGAHYDQKNLKPSFLAFVKSAESTHDSSKLPTFQVHISFLLTLICKYMVCFAGKDPAKEFIPLAISLAHGKHVALAPFLLAYLYKYCYDITVYPLGSNRGLL